MPLDCVLSKKIAVYRCVSCLSLLCLLITWSDCVVSMQVACRYVWWTRCQSKVGRKWKCDLTLAVTRFFWLNLSFSIARGHFDRTCSEQVGSSSSSTSRGNHDINRTKGFRGRWNGDGHQMDFSHTNWLVKPCCNPLSGQDRMWQGFDSLADTLLLFTSMTAWLTSYFSSPVWRLGWHPTSLHQYDGLTDTLLLFTSMTAWLTPYFSSPVWRLGWHPTSLHQYDGLAHTLLLFTSMTAWLIKVGVKLWYFAYS